MSSRNTTEPVAEARLAGFDRLVRRCMVDWGVPGVAVGIVWGRRTVWVKGYGRRDMKRDLPVTEDTKFYTGSCGKAFTATAMGILVDEGKLQWDRPVREYLPSFRMYDPVATERTTPRDLLTHRTGLGRHGRAWLNSSATRLGIVERLRHLEPAADFRAAFQYSNVNYIVAGALMEYVTGQTWEELIRSRLLMPLRMTAGSVA